MSLAELAERTGLVKSTILRLTLSLQRYRLLARLPDGSYRLDAENLRLGTAYQQASRLSDHVMPVLEQLAAKTGETTSFYVRNGDERHVFSGWRAPIASGWPCNFGVEAQISLRRKGRVGRADYTFTYSAC